MDFYKEDFEGYKAQVEQSIKISKMAIMTDENTLEWINEQIKTTKKRPVEKPKK